MTLLGDRAWWLPRWLDRILPNVSMEGHLVESLDPALLRPGRFEFQLYIPYPEADDRPGEPGDASEEGNDRYRACDQPPDEERRGAIFARYRGPEDPGESHAEGADHDGFHRDHPPELAPRAGSDPNRSACS